MLRAEVGERIRQKEGGVRGNCWTYIQERAPQFLCLLFAYFLWLPRVDEESAKDRHHIV